MVNPYKPPLDSKDQRSQLPLQPIRARELFGWWVMMVLLPTLVFGGLLVVFGG